VTGARALELLLGTDSGYVRDIVTEELAKGLDAYWRLTTDDALDAVRANLLALLRVCNQPCFRLYCFFADPAVVLMVEVFRSFAFSQ
jgi:hypothetical protein